MPFATVSTVNIIQPSTKLILRWGVGGRIATAADRHIDDEHTLAACKNRRQGTIFAVQRFMNQSIIKRSAVAPNGKPILFLHVTKCGGTSLRSALIHSLSSEGTSAAALYQLDAVGSTALAIKVGMDTFALRDLLLTTQLNNREIRFIAGHFRYTTALHQDEMSDCTSITILREPVDRFLSLFYYNSYKSIDYGRESLPLEEYITTPKARRNAEDYVRIFRGNGVAHGDYATEQEVQLACDNLDYFSVVGCLDRIDEFVNAFEDATTYSLDIPRLNTTPAPLTERYADLSSDILSEIERLCAPSVVVYQKAQRLVNAGSDRKVDRPQTSA